MMNSFILTPEIKAKRKRMRVELALLKGKKKTFGKLSEKDEQRQKEIMLELSKRY